MVRCSEFVFICVHSWSNCLGCGQALLRFHAAHTTLHASRFSPNLVWGERTFKKVCGPGRGRLVPVAERASEKTWGRGRPRPNLERASSAGLAGKQRTWRLNCGL